MQTQETADNKDSWKRDDNFTTCQEWKGVMVMDKKRKEKESERLLSKPILFQSKSCQPIRWPKHQATDQGKVGKESFLSTERKEC